MCIQIVKNEIDQIQQSALKRVFPYWFFKTNMKYNDT